MPALSTLSLVFDKQKGELESFDSDNSGTIDMNEFRDLFAIWATTLGLAQNFGVASDCLVSSGDDSTIMKTANAETAVSLAFALLLSVKDLGRVKEIKILDLADASTRVACATGPLVLVVPGRPRHQEQRHGGFLL